MPIKRRRKKRSRWSPLRYVPPDVLALIGKGVAGGLVVAAPAVAVRQEGVAKAQTQNEALNVSLGAAAALQESLSVFREQFGQFRREIRESRLRERDTKSRLPENAVGPVVPIARHWWQRR